MIARARERAGAAERRRIRARRRDDARFAPRWANLMFSRFGVMFFADPVLAFANLRKGLARGGRVVVRLLARGQAQRRGRRSP